MTRKHKRTSRYFPADTPVSIRRAEANGRPSEIIREPAPPTCIWPDCAGEPYNEVIPVCARHMFEIYDYVKQSDLDEPREVAIQRNRRQRAADERSRRAWLKQQKLRESRGSQPGWIYYLHIDGKIKIGYTTDIVQRMRQYPPGSPLAGVHPGTPELEKRLHRQFAGSLAQGREWFNPTPDLLEHCEQVVKEYGDPKKFEYQARDPHAQRQFTAVRGWSGRRTA